MFPRTGRLGDINQEVSSHVETVVLLCRKTPDDVIKVKFTEEQMRFLDRWISADEKK